jgi:hypothetical protein
MRKSVHLTIEGKNGIFRQENTLSLFLKHTTQDSFASDLKELRKLSAGLIKSGELMITLCSMDENFNRNDEARYIYRGSWNGTIILEVRKFNGYDYSESKELHFTKDLDLLKYMIIEIDTTIRKIMGNLPEQSWYSQLCDGVELPSDVAEIVTR